MSENSGKKHNDASTSEDTEGSSSNGSRRIPFRIPNSGASFLLPGDVPASPPKFVSLQELMRAANNMTNMALAHEIVVNDDFKLEALQAPQNSLEKAVRESMHKAFWDILDQELNADPPSYTQALMLLSEVRDSLLELLLPQHTKIKLQICEVLDLDLIRQQTVAGTLDFQQYAQYVISVMGKLCAPVRDERIADLNKLSGVVDVFKNILETLDVMKLDMANFTLSMMKPQIVASSVQYEKNKFADYLRFQQDGLAVTKLWLQRHLSAASDNNVAIDKRIDQVVNHAYLELVEWDSSNPFPETLAMDESRILELRSTFRKLTLIGAVLLLTFSRAGPDLCSVAELKTTLKTHTVTLLNGLGTEGAGELRSVLKDVVVKLEHDLQAAAEKYLQQGQTPQSFDLEPHILGVADEDHKIVALLKQRIREFLLATITSQTAEPTKIPPGLSTLREELSHLTGTLLRLTSHNRAVFGEYYHNIVKEALPPGL